MLRNKIDKEMDKFHIVEFAFKEIKTSTVPFTPLRVSTMPRHWCTSTSIRKPSTENSLERSPTIRRP